MEDICGVRVSATIRLVQHAHSWNWNQSCPMSDGSLLQDTAPGCRFLLQPSFPTEADTRKLLETKQRQQHYYNKQVRPWEPICMSDTVHMRLLGKKTWSPGICTAEVSPQSYRVQVGNAIYRRSRRQLIKTGKSSEPTSPEDVYLR